MMAFIFANWAWIQIIGAIITALSAYSGAPQEVAMAFSTGDAVDASTWWNAILGGGSGISTFLLGLWAKWKHIGNSELLPAVEAYLKNPSEHNKQNLVIVTVDELINAYEKDAEIAAAAKALAKIVIEKRYGEDKEAKK